MDSLTHDRQEVRASTTMARETLEHVMTETAVDTTVADSLGLTRDMATGIVESGLPLRAHVASTYL